MSFKFIAGATLATWVVIVLALLLLGSIDLMIPGTHQREIELGIPLVLKVMVFSFVGWTALCFVVSTVCRFVKESFIGMWVSHDPSSVK